MRIYRVLSMLNGGLGGDHRMGTDFADAVAWAAEVRFQIVASEAAAARTQLSLFGVGEAIEPGKG